MSCIACGLELETHEYQSRSADEAHTSVTTCAKCPIDAIKLNPIRMPNAPYRGLHTPIRRPLHVRVSSAGSRVGSAQTILVDVPRNHPYHSVDLQEYHVTTMHKVVSATSGGKLFERNGTYTIAGPLSNMCVLETRRTDIGIGVVIVDYGTYTPASRCAAQQRTVNATYTNVSAITGLETYVYRQSGSYNSKVLIVLPNCARNNTWINVVNSVMASSLIPESVSSYIKADFVARLSNLSARAWDATTAPESGHVFTCKPDGERMWLVLYGSVWYMVPPRFKGPIKHWYTMSRTAMANDTVVLDVEYVGRHGIILIDTLTSCDGAPAPVARDMNWAVNQFHIIKARFELPPVTVRKYFRNYTDALAYSSTVAFPTDGVVAVRDGSTEILKVKSIKSMELHHSGNGTLTTADGQIVATSLDAERFDIGDIVEVRFTVNKALRTLNVVDMFRRVDKMNANSTQAVANIVASGLELRTKDDNDRRAALMWCNALRKLIHARAISRKDNRTIILDIGSGDGQSLDSMMTSESTSCIYLEPDTFKCKKLAKRLGVKKIVTDPIDIVPMIRSLKTRLTNSVVLNCTLNDIIDCTQLLERILPELKCIMCTFSMHFVTDELQDISAICTVPIYGCGYLYDAVSDNGTLVESSGVTMKRINENDASVKWGNDNQYNEPATVTSHYVGLGRTVKGKDLLDLPDKSINPGAVPICDKVYVLVP